MELQIRIEKFLDWCESEIIKERKSIAANKAYINNHEYFERIRIKPLIAAARLMHDLCNEADMLLTNQVEEKFKQIEKYNRRTRG